MANRAFARTQRRKTAWTGIGRADGGSQSPLQVALTAGAPSLIARGVYSTGAGAKGTPGAEDESTITRMIGSLIATLNVSSAAVNAQVAIGAIIVRQEAAVAGVASMPSPEDSPELDWLYHTYIQLRNPNSTLVDGPSSSMQRTFDVRGQRVVRNRDELVWLAESTTQNCTVQVGGRVLFLLP